MIVLLLIVAAWFVLGIPAGVGLAKAMRAASAADRPTPKPPVQSEL